MIKVGMLGWIPTHESFLNRVELVLEDEFEVIRANVEDQAQGAGPLLNSSIRKPEFKKLLASVVNLSLIASLFFLQKILVRIPGDNLKPQLTHQYFCRKVINAIELSVQDSRESKSPLFIVNFLKSGFPFKRIEQEFSTANKIYNKLKSAHLLIIPEDNIFYFCSIYTNHFTSRGIPCLVIPYTHGTTTADWESIFFFRRDFRTRISSALTTVLYPRYVHKFAEKRMGLPDLASVLVAEYFKHTPNIPWSGILGHCNAYFVSDKDYKYFSDHARVDPSKLIITESPERTLVNVERARNVSAGAIGSTCFNFLVLIPPDMFPLPDGAKPEFMNYQELLDFLIVTTKKFESEKVEFLFSFHPSTRNKVELTSLYPGFTFSNESLIHDLAVADSVICFSSGLIETIIDLGLDVIDWNIYGFVSTPDSSLRDSSRYHKVADRSSYFDQVTKLVSNGRRQSSLEINQNNIDISRAILRYLRNMNDVC